jgi:hypothetical protein
MTELDGTLSELARLRSGSEPIVSLYLDVRWNDEQQRERVRLFVQDRCRKILGHYLPDSPGCEGLRRTLDRIQKYVSGLTGQAYEAEKNGLALFACESSNLWRPLFFARSFENELAADGVPHLAQLVRLSDDCEPALVIMPGPDGADIYQLTLGELALQSALHRGPAPHRDKEFSTAGTAKPGHHFEREGKDERHSEEYQRRSWKAAGTEATVLFDSRHGCHLVFVGTSENVAAFERELPDRLRERVIARLPRPRDFDRANGARHDGVIQGAADAVRMHERSAEERDVDAVVGESLRGGLAVLGPDDVVQALNQGRVHRLVLEEDFERAGWRCDNCDALGSNAEAAEKCIYCGGDVRVLHDLGEALVARTLSEGGEVELVAHQNKLHSYKGVGAFLRQTSATGLRGASQPWPTAPGANQG